jgi:hypothetical protein
VALDFPVGTDFPTNGNQIPDGHEYQGFYWDATTGVWKRVCEPDDPFDPTVVECIDDERTTSLGTLPYQSSGDTLTADGVKSNITSGALASTLTELEFGTDADETVFLVDGQLQLTNTTLGTPTDTFEITAVDGSKVTVTYKDGDAATVYNTDDELTVVHNGGLQVNADCLFCEGDDRSICEEINLLQNQVIELEEEIDAIAPSVEYGTWEWQNPTADNATRPPAAGTFYLAKDGPSGALDPVVTDQYLDTEVIVIHNNEYVAAGDTDPVDSHSWSDADDGKLIQLFDRADPDFFLGTILSTQVEADHVRIRVERVQSSGVPNDNADPDTGDFLSRINIFNPPSGGDASEFVKKSGDTMEGPSPLMFKTAKDSYVSSTPGTGTAYIKFQNKYGTGTGVHEVNIFMGGGNNSPNGLCITGRPLHVSSTIYSSGLYKARNSTTEYSPNLYIQSTEGQLRYNTTNKLSWQSDGIREIIIKNNDGDKGMVIKRDRSTTNRVEWSGVVDIDTSGSNRCIGELWYNKNDGVMYLRIS